MTNAVVQRQRMKGTLSRITAGDIVWFPDDTVSIIVENYDGSFWSHQLYPPVSAMTPARPLASTGAELFYEILGAATIEYDHCIPMAMLDRSGSWRELARCALDAGNFFRTMGYATDLDGADERVPVEVDFDYRDVSTEPLRYAHSIDFVFFEFFYPYREDKSPHYGFKLSTAKWVLGEDGEVTTLAEADNYNLHMDAEGGPLYSRYFHPLGDLEDLPPWILEGQTRANAIAITKIWGAYDIPPLSVYAVAKLKAIAEGDRSLPLIWDSEKGLAWK